MVVSEQKSQCIEFVYDDGTGLYRRLRDGDAKHEPRPIVFARDSTAALITALLPGNHVRVKSAKELAAESAKSGAIAFVECDLLCHVDVDVIKAPIVGIIDESSDTLPRMIRSLDAFPWLAHFVTTTLLARPMARAHLSRLISRLVFGSDDNMITEAGIGRVALLACASRREARFERMRDFFASKGVKPRTIARINEVFEELVTNALYDAPVEAGYFKKAVPRTEDVDLPKDRACEVSYGIEDGTAYVRIRDTFGALTRARLLSVLKRCNANNVSLDESRGGAGLGLWRVFSAASTLSITVCPGQLTEIVVGLTAKDRPKASTQMLAIDMFFAKRPTSTRYVTGQDDGLLDDSITLVRVA